MHIFDGYIVTQGRVRGRCSCGFLTTPQSARRAARQQLQLSHGFTETVCDACGRGDWSRTGAGAGLPASLVARVDAATGDERLLCAESSGGCDLTTHLGPEAAQQLADAIADATRS
ncbi:hypothetical protein [Solicola sp. PLA-1-18]|uniref:hypothetical protein n=1 Tax=Solicola sp. PLA-1-18 TaxID=3380532 RepID=UPI003B7AEC37